MSVKRLTEHNLEFLSLKGGCTGKSESTLVKMPHCWKSRVMAHFILYYLTSSCNQQQAMFCYCGTPCSYLNILFQILTDICIINCGYFIVTLKKSDLIITLYRSIINLLIYVNKTYITKGYSTLMPTDNGFLEASLSN